jgi:hypothetical protein
LRGFGQMSLDRQISVALVCRPKLQLFYVNKQEYVNEHIEHTETNSNC